MSIWRQVSSGLRALMNRSAADRDVSDEVAHYIDEATAANIARGLSPDDARREFSVCRHSESSHPARSSR